jgi:hypothetical protein
MAIGVLGRGLPEAGRVQHQQHGPLRALSHCRLVPPHIHLIPYSIPYSAPLFLKRRRDRTAQVHTDPKFAVGYARMGAAIGACGRNMSYSCSWPAALGDDSSAKVSKTPCRPRIWANFSLLHSCIPHRSAWANLLRLGPPDTALASSSVKVTGLAQKLGQLEAVHRDFQSKYWANLKLLGQPCNFYASAQPFRQMAADGCNLWRD